MTVVFICRATAYILLEWRRFEATDLLLVNGPGTCVPVVLVVWALNLAKCLAGIPANRRAKIIFVESICRVKTLSLTGKILLRFADHVLVQWPDLAVKYPSVKYIDRFL